LVFHVSISKLELETQCKVENGKWRMGNKKWEIRKT
jgi:hypothetical protein